MQSDYLISWQAWSLKAEDVSLPSLLRQLRDHRLKVLITRITKQYIAKEFCLKWRWRCNRCSCLHSTLLVECTFSWLQFWKCTFSKLLNDSILITSWRVWKVKLSLENKHSSESSNCHHSCTIYGTHDYFQTYVHFRWRFHLRAHR